MNRRAVLVFILAGIALPACGGGGPQLDARVLQLSITYAVDGPSSAQLTGDTGAARAGAEVECRLTAGGKPVVGEATANEVGAFVMPLDHAGLPARVPTADEFPAFNDIIECRPEGGTWVTPLRPPMIKVG